ncbi:AAA-like domain-containing protein [Roseofilum casamattae]|uniref:AAA-like domain-containing protein n=1 Tax=Roseofilum casamattae BLCC-M143 TaxID=3022442 RepID=A0ABT7C054_9CYAN|nr:AAA-like domain-containing protein [Roseofilum casamattae]MDJ1184832.1 AAA-like domain-containing protein [Roseofilum casamattae BLCC-M143]
MNQALARNGYTSQKIFSEDIRISRATVNKFFTGKPVSNYNFSEICKWLGLDPKEIGQVFMESAEEKAESDQAIEVYVERPEIEQKCYAAISQPGSLLRIKAPKQMGKTRLANKIIAKTTKLGYRKIYLRLQDIDRCYMQQLNLFLQQLCLVIRDRFQLDISLSQYWDETISSKRNFIKFLERYILGDRTSALVLCFDNIDLILPYPEVAEEFFSLLRSLHERAKINSLWKKLRLIIVHATEVYIPLNIDRSPFNVGVSIELPPFNLTQATEFAKKSGIRLQTNEINQLMDLLNGHPALIEQTFKELKIEPSLTLCELLAGAETQSGIYSTHLHTLLTEIRKNPELQIEFSKVISSEIAIKLDTIVSYKLHSLGLIHYQNDKVVVSCNLYRFYFQDRLAN